MAVHTQSFILSQPHMPLPETMFDIPFDYKEFVDIVSLWRNMYNFMGCMFSECMASLGEVSFTDRIYVPLWSLNKNKRSNMAQRFFLVLDCQFLKCGRFSIVTVDHLCCHLPHPSMSCSWPSTTFATTSFWNYNTASGTKAETHNLGWLLLR